MHLFYHQRADFLSEEVDPDGILIQGLGGIRQDLDQGPAASSPPAPAAVEDRVAMAQAQAAALQKLRATHADLQCRLETGALRAENEHLEGQVVQMQEDFFALQRTFHTEKEQYGEKLAKLSQALEAQRADTQSAERRVICTEDLVRFYEEQRRLMAGHWKAQTQNKDERIRHLNLQLTEYTADWQHLGSQKQTEASLSHEAQCLMDRHAELAAERQRRESRREGLGARLAESRAELAELREAEAEGEARASVRHAHCAQQLPLRKLEAQTAGLRSRALLIADMQRLRDERAQGAMRPPTPSAGPAPEEAPPWPHSCIWRDELDVREGQLEKITAQLSRTNDALNAAQAALEQQRSRHEEVKMRHREAEATLREADKRRSALQRQTAELKRSEVELRRAADSRADAEQRRAEARAELRRAGGQPEAPG